MNVRESRREARIKRIRSIIDTSLESGKDVSYKKMIAYCMIEMGYERRTAREILDAFIDLGVYSRDGDNISKVNIDAH